MITGFPRDTALFARRNRHETLLSPRITTSRPRVAVSSPRNDIKCELRVIELLKGEHYQPEYGRSTRNRLVTRAGGRDFRLTESRRFSSTSRRKRASSAYPEGAALTGEVNEMMDWINTQGLSRIRLRAGLPAKNLPEPQEAQRRGARGQIAWARKKGPGLAEKSSMKTCSGQRESIYAARQITIADYFGGPFVALGEIVRCNYSAYPNVNRWLDRMKTLKKLGKGARGLPRIRRLAQGQGLRGRLRRWLTSAAGGR